jgi:hypothetical protein
MVNKARGEAALEAGGRQYRLLLTLGALAEIEDGLGLDDLSGVAVRLRQVKAADLAIVAAALRAARGMTCARPKCCGCPATWARCCAA